MKRPTLTGVEQTKLSREKERENRMERNWIFIESSPEELCFSYKDYQAEDEPTLIKRVWNDGYVEYYETTEP